MLHRVERERVTTLRKVLTLLGIGIVKFRLLIRERKRVLIRARLVRNGVVYMASVVTN